MLPGRGVGSIEKHAKSMFITFQKRLKPIKNLKAEEKSNDIFDKMRKMLIPSDTKSSEIL